MKTRGFDCIFIPGGGLLEDGSLPPWTVARLEKALEIQSQTEWIIPLSGGTVHKAPPLDPDRFPYFESRQAAAYLASAALDPGRILTETSSYDTIGNAYFSRVLFADPLGLARCCVITSQFHLARTRAAFQWVYSLRPVTAAYQLSFEGAPDRGLESDALEARRARESASLEKLGGKIQAITTLGEFQRWLYAEHGAYAVQEDKEDLTDAELQTY